MTVAGQLVASRRHAEKTVSQIALKCFTCDMDGQISRPIVLNGRVLDTKAGILRDASGSEIPLRPQSYQVFRFLAENPNRIVTKNELFDAVWPNTAVTENSLVQCIHEIRRAIEDESQVILKTAARRGYQLVVPNSCPPREMTSKPIGPLAELASGNLGRKRQLIYAAAVAVVATLLLVIWKPIQDQSPAVPASIAVLPFSYESDTPQRADFAQGFTEDVITDLTRFRDLEVIAPSSIKKYEGESQDTQQVATELHVRYVLQGSIRRQNDHLRVTAQLIEAASGVRVWAEQWDRRLEDAFTIETDLAHELAERSEDTREPFLLQTSKLRCANAQAT